MTGDGIPDGVLVSYKLGEEDLPLSISVAVGQGDGWSVNATTWFSAPPSNVSSGTDRPRYILADLNDDLKQDVVVVYGSKLFALYSHDNGFAPRYVPNTENNDTQPVAASLLSKSRKAKRRSLLSQTPGKHTSSDHSSNSRQTVPRRFSDRQAAAGKRLLSHIAARQDILGQGAGMAFSTSSAAVYTHGDEASTGRWPKELRHAYRRSLLQSISASDRNSNTSVELLATLSSDLAACTFHPYGVNLAPNVPGSQLLLACPSGRLLILFMAGTHLAATSMQLPTPANDSVPGLPPSSAAVASDPGSPSALAPIIIQAFIPQLNVSTPQDVLVTVRSSNGAAITGLSACSLGVDGTIACEDRVEANVDLSSCGVAVADIIGARALAGWMPLETP